MKKNSVRRVVVALDDSNCSRVVLQTSARIAGLFEAELIGLFVEDRNLYSLAELPFATELGMSGGVRPLRREQLEQEYDCVVREIESWSTSAVSGLVTHWRFERCRGAVVDELIGRGEQADLLSMGRFGRPLCPEPDRLGSVARSLLSRGRAPILLQHQQLSDGDPISLFLEGDAGDQKILEMGAALARIYGSRLYVGAGEGVLLRDSIKRVAQNDGGVESESGVSTEVLARRGGMLVCRRQRFNPVQIHANVLLI